MTEVVFGRVISSATASWAVFLIGASVHFGLGYYGGDIRIRDADSAC
jgi:hypothetical protein